MHRGRKLFTGPRFAALALFLSGCGDGADPTAVPPPRSQGAHANLVLRLPEGAIEAPLVREVRTLPAPRGPAPVAEPVDATERPLQQIFDARTRTGFDPGFAFALGTHDYIGNVGKIVTTATATFEDKLLGSQSAERQDYSPFFLDFGIRKTIWTWVKIYTEHTCGVTVDGSSRHFAWWEMYQGRSAPQWGVTTRTTQGTPSRQPGCRNTGSYETGAEKPGGIVCYYWITYDLDTGEVLSADFLYCSNSSGSRL